MRLNNNWIKVGSLVAALGVVLGAFAAYGLDALLTNKYAGQTKVVLGEEISTAYKYLGDFETAAHYQLLHALAIVMVGIQMAHRPRKMLTIAAWCFLLGIVFFSGSSYLLVLTGETKFGAGTPIGGLLLIGGWIAVVEGACPGDNPPLDSNDASNRSVA